jgi:hypothetical protein
MFYSHDKQLLIDADLRSALLARERTPCPLVQAEWVLEQSLRVFAENLAENVIQYKNSEGHMNKPRRLGAIVQDFRVFCKNKLRF